LWFFGGEWGIGWKPSQIVVLKREHLETVKGCVIDFEFKQPPQ